MTAKITEKAGGFCIEALFVENYQETYEDACDFCRLLGMEIEDGELHKGTSD